MKRKVIQLAVKTLVISIPHEWAKNNNIEKGSEVEVIEKPDRLLVLTDKKSESASIDLNIENKVFDKRYISDLYLKGYDEIIIHFSDKDVLEEIKKIDLLGYEIMEEDDKKCVIRSVSQVLEDQFDQMLRKSFFISKEMGKRILDYMKGEDVDLMELRKLESKNNKLTDFCLRVLNKNGHKDGSKTNFLYIICRESESICDIFKYLIDDLINLKDNKDDLDNISIDLFERALGFFESFTEIFYNYDQNKFKEFYKERRILISLCRKMIVKGNAESIISHHCLNLIVETYNIMGPYLTMNFQEIY